MTKKAKKKKKEEDEGPYEDLVVQPDPSVVDDEGVVYERINVNFWATKLHSDTIGVRMQAQRQAQSRQFSKGMEVQGEVEFKGDKDKRYNIAFNEEMWDYKDPDMRLRKKFKDENEAKLNRRLIIKTFTDMEEGKGGRWTGTLESSLLDSLSLSIGTRKPLPVFKIIVPGKEHVYNLYRTHTITGHRYMFYIFDKNKKVRHFEIEGQAFAIGDDFRVEDTSTGKQVAYIDGKAVDLGGKWEIKIKDKELAGDNTFRLILIMFACLTKYHNEVNDSVEELYKAITKEHYKFKPDAYEMSFYRNPRMRR